jgi:ADP-ribosylation factor-binding protein GGA
VLGLSGLSVPSSQAQQPAAPQSNNDLLGGLSSPPPSSSQFASPLPSTFSPAPPAQPARSPDPFASLTQTPRQGSPFQFQQSVKSQPPPTAPAAVDLLGGLGSAAPPPAPAQNNSIAHDDDEWDFASAVPTPETKEITVTEEDVKIVFAVSRETDSTLLIKSRISNKTPSPVTQLTFQSAVSKVCLFH